MKARSIKCCLRLSRAWLPARFHHRSHGHGDGHAESLRFRAHTGDWGRERAGRQVPAVSPVASASEAVDRQV